MEPNLPKTLNDLLEANEATGTWTVLMTCGLAGWCHKVQTMMIVMLMIYRVW